MTSPEIPIRVQYVDPAKGFGDLSLALGVVGYGTGRPEYLPENVAFIEAPISPVGGAMLEIWSGAVPGRPVQFGSVTGACSEDIAFGALVLPRAAGGALEAVVERAYLEIFDFMEASGFSEPLRVWNYLTRIIAEEDGMQRYMRFNIGRAKAYAARLRQAVPPAASGVGGYAGESVIYFLSGKTPARAIENPRQVSAYHYPPVYGPTSPSFSRASVYEKAGSATMFVSGTASIVGHETRHVDDVGEQIAETARNLAALIGQAGLPQDDGAWAAKIYLRNREDKDAVSLAVDEVFGTRTKRLFLQSEICRTGLKLEIEAFRQPVQPALASGLRAL